MSDEAEDLYPELGVGQPHQQRGVEWAREKFRSFDDGEYRFRQITLLSSEFAEAAMVLASIYHKDRVVNTRFRGKSGDTILRSRVATRSKSMDSFSSDLIFVIRDGQVVEVVQDDEG
jgi:hypothetical protein